MSSASTLLIPMLKEVLLKEIGEASVPPLPWRKLNTVAYLSEITLDGIEIPINIDFQDFDKFPENKQYNLPDKLQNIHNSYNVAYMVGGSEEQFKTATVKDLLQILSTVVDVCRDFIDSIDPNSLFIKETPKTISDKKRQKSILYQAYIQKQLDSLPGYHAAKRRDGYIVGKLKYM